MRGHWLSQTRKLNKHYQSGGGSAPVDPFVFAPIKVGGAWTPLAYQHMPGTTNPYTDTSVYYNECYDMGLYSPHINFARFQGLIAKQYLRKDRLYVPSRNSITNWRNWSQTSIDQYDMMVGQLFPYPDPQYYTQGETWKDLADRGADLVDYEYGCRFVRYRICRYGWGPNYMYRPGSFPVIPTDPTNFTMRDKTTEQEPIYTGTQITAKACLAADWDYTRSPQQINPRSQVISIRQKLIDDTIYEPAPDGYGLSVGTNIGHSIFDHENAGQSYCTNLSLNQYAKIVPHGNPINTPIYVYIKCFCFCYDGYLYVDQKAHVFDPNTEEEITDVDVYFRDIRYPSNLGGVCHIGSLTPEYGLPGPPPPEFGDPVPEPWVYQYWMFPWTLSDGTRYEWNNLYGWRYHPQGQLAPVTGGVDPIPIFSGQFAGRIVYPWQAYGVDDLGNTSTWQQNYLIMDEVTEEDFWAAEAAWHDLHGGEPYTPPEEET